MKLKNLFLIVLCVFALSCKQNQQTVVVAGDSWATFICVYKSLDKSLEKEGVLDTSVNATCPLTTRTGMHAEDWFDSSFHKATKVALEDPTVKVLYLSLGGNDFLSLWNNKLSPADESKLFNTIAANVADVIQQYHELRPDIKIILSGYDYPRFIPNHPIAEYKEAFENMGQPTPLELNSAILRYSEVVSKGVDQKSSFYIHHYGLMHYYFGNPEMGLQKLTSAPPENISSPSDPIEHGGVPSLQSDPSALLKLDMAGIEIVDAFHLSRTAYGYLADHTVSHYLKKWLTVKP